LVMSGGVPARSAAMSYGTISIGPAARLIVTWMSGFFLFQISTTRSMFGAQFQ